MPTDLRAALSHAVMLIGWQENLLEAEMPPRWMWSLDDDLTEHFERVKAKRDAGLDIDDDDAPMMKNEYAKDRGPNLR